MLNKKTIPDPSKAFSASIELLMLSPEGLVQCAADGFERAKRPYGFDDQDAGFIAANQVLAAGPESFIKASHPVDWKTSPRSKFWSSFFQARAQGCKVTSLKSILCQCPKDVLTQGATHMLMRAIEAKDISSFQELLECGAAKRSKSIMFLAYQYGGKPFALSVKVPTPKEASTMLSSGGGSWPSLLNMVHDADSFEWLLNLSGTPVTGLLAAQIVRIAVNPGSFEDVIRKNVNKLSFEPDVDYLFEHGLSINRSEHEQVQKVILALSSAGCPQAAKALAMDKGGVELWHTSCVKGFASTFMLPVRSSTPHGRGGHVTVGDPVRGGELKDKRYTTVQHATVLSGHLKACTWLRGEYERLNAKWGTTAHLRGAYWSLTVKRFDSEIDGPLLLEASLAMSEAIDLRGEVQRGKIVTRKDLRSL